MPLNVTLPSRLFYGLLQTSEADVPVIDHASNAVPSGYRYTLLTITIVNNGTSDRTVKLRIVPSGDTPGDEHNILPGQTDTVIKAGKTAVITGQWVLHAGDKVRGSCSSNDQVTVRGDGITVGVA